MGFRVQLIAVSGKDPRIVQRDYGVAPTGDREQIPESAVVGAALPNGAYLLYINDPNRIAPDDEVFSRLSQGASLIACYANETTMQSYTCAWSNGVEMWSVSHVAQKGINHLEAAGHLPPALHAIRDRVLARQAGDNGVDFVFDIPVELFAALGGMRYDHDIPGNSPEPWETMESAQ
jgi:hypothetical protein